MIKSSLQPPAASSQKKKPRIPLMTRIKFTMKIMEIMKKSLKMVKSKDANHELTLMGANIF